MKIDHIRREFLTHPLLIDDLPSNPHDLFHSWFLDVLHEKVEDPTACVLATADENNIPDTRVVLLKSFSDERFVFFTNYFSRKGVHLAKNPWGAMNFYWASVIRQIRLRGQIVKISQAESEKYFQSRPRESQIAAYASKQSQVITRQLLEKQFNDYEKKFQSIVSIPCPEVWGGYALIANEIEFWQGDRYRLHYRICYTKENNIWNKKSLSP